MKIKPPVFAVVVTYNPNLKDLGDSLKALSKQVQKVLVVNNSSFSIAEAVGLGDEMIVIELKFNFGIAYAQNLGMKKAFELGAEFVLQMDQDSIPDSGMVYNLLACYNDLVNDGVRVGLVGVQDFDKFTQEVNMTRANSGTPIPGTPYFIVSETLSSGSLIHKKVFEEVGGMEDRLFIDAVDSEYCWRLQKAGYLVIRNSKALLGHRLGDGCRTVFGTLTVRIDAPFRHYYQFRNVLLLQTRSYVPFKWRVINLAKLLFKLFFYPFAFRDGKQRIKFMLLGIVDAMQGKYGIMGGTHGKN